MSDFACPVVRVGRIERHPNADTLSTTVVEGETTIVKTGDFREGDLAVYVPVDAVVPPSVPGTEFLGEHRRIRAKRLRGIYSEGLLLPMSVLGPHADPAVHHEGFDEAYTLGIKKHEDQVPSFWGGGGKGNTRGTSEEEKNPGFILKYDVEPYKKYHHLMVDGERVVVTEKLHGTQARYCLEEDDEGGGRKLYVGSHNRLWRDPFRPVTWGEKLADVVFRATRRWGRPLRRPRENLYWQVARQYDMKNALPSNYVLYGEIYGQVQDLKYGAADGQVWFRVFDVYDPLLGKWVDWDEVVEACQDYGFDTVPVLYDGPFSEEKLAGLVEGQSVLAGNIREGVVVKPAVTRVDPHFGRVVLKWVSQAYRLRKGGTELH